MRPTVGRTPKPFTHKKRNDVRRKRLTISMDYLIAPIFGHEYPTIHQRAAERIVDGCLANGGLYIKLGQGLAAMNHILPKEYIDTLTILQDKCLKHGADELEKIFLQDFGSKPEQVFLKIEPEPVAAASIAQVFKAVTTNGENVAIKVQYIDLQDRFSADIKTVDFLLKIISIMHPKFNFHWVLDEMRDTLVQELDFENEGRNSEKCARDLQSYSYAYVPKVHWDCTSKRVLTTEWIDGIKINNVKELKRQQLSLAEVDKKLFTIMAQQIFHSGFVHADPHPGNILVRKVTDNTAQIVLLDHGLYEEVPEHTRHTLCNYWESIVLRDNKRLKYYARQLNVDDYILFGEMLTQTPMSVFGLTTIPPGLSADEYMKKQAQERFDKVMVTLRAMPKSILLVIRNLNTVRAIAREHGDPIDRYRLMARMAVLGKHKLAQHTLWKRLIGKVSRVRFEIQLWSQSFSLWLFGCYLRFLKLLGFKVDIVMNQF
ncbi:uncharacterized aarF domain-containing protein kinase 5 isoform X2 [Cephus cinctus]|uniref:Uncharacterized aarF domain-containing protein kinase 5 isoform X2 n=1 Tax=Cephus cinctus TaxID=211228 RepID=A0AAJ7FGY4_CEPCN|nr:uncharacterized aarF domain-containing protein kinase 5 isoform X2 [Cephus cinctus]